MEQMGGWGATMDIPCDRPAEMHRSAAVCFGKYQTRASERRAELEFDIQRAVNRDIFL